jgi:hypothetical protein
VPDDDDILESYEQELDDPAFHEPMRRSNRGFWMVAITITLGAVVLMVEIFANRPMVNAISRTEHDLKVALRNADRVFADGGTFTPADAAALAAIDGARTYVGPDEPAGAPGVVSVYASGDTWAAASPSEQGTCFYVKQMAGQDTLYLVADGACTGREALRSTETQW